MKIAESTQKKELARKIRNAERELNIRRQWRKCKAEMKRLEELTTAQQKEQRRLEEKAKAQEALERKKRIAEKAQLRVELRAQKEAEQKERREKRLRKKERNTTDGEITSSTEEKKIVRYTNQIKNIALPPALYNRGRKRLKQIMWWAFGALIVLFAFVVGSGCAFGNLKLCRDDSIFGTHGL